MSFSSSPNLGQGLGGWRPLNFANAVTLETENDPGLARSSTSYAYARTTEGGGSFALDFQWPTIQVNYSGDTQNGDAYGGTTGPWWPSSITIIAWTRVRPGAPNFNFQLSLWGLGASPQPHDYVNATATQEWQMMTICAANAQQRTRRIEFYLNTVGSDLLVDSVNFF